jgi:hypothetical protein
MLVDPVDANWTSFKEVATRDKVVGFGELGNVDGNVVEGVEV